MNNDIFDDEEILEVIDLLQAALHFAGVPDSKLNQATQAYLQEMQKQDDDAEYNRVAIINLIDSLRKSHKHLFEHA